MIKYVEEIPSNYIEIDSGLIKVEKMPSGEATLKHLMSHLNICENYIIERLQSKQSEDLLNSEEILFSLGKPILSKSSGNYFVPIIILRSNET